jgi:prolipoprotein diacylglyceryltransferase
MGIPVSILGGRMGSAILGEAQWNEFFDFRGGGMAVE